MTQDFVKTKQSVNNISVGIMLAFYISYEYHLNEKRCFVF